MDTYKVLWFQKGGGGHPTGPFHPTAEAAEAWLREHVGPPGTVYWIVKVEKVLEADVLLRPAFEGGAR